MNRSLLALAALALAAPVIAAPEWVELGATDQGTAISIRPVPSTSSQLRKVWVRFGYATQNHPVMARHVVLYSLNCAEQTSRVEQVAGYRRDGSVTDEVPPQTVDYIVPDSALARVSAIVCAG
jgi:cell wall assembly regulator SMI1